MNRLFNKFMLVVFGVSLGLFVVLSGVVVVLGPRRTDMAIRNLFVFENYLQDYQKYFPYVAGSENTDAYSSDVLGISNRKIIDVSDDPPLLVPSEGIAPSSHFLYTGLLSEGKHEGIDIWTNRAGRGMDGAGYGKGNPVYASCSGYVRNVWMENGDVSVICDTLPDIYEGVVPSLEVKTLYGHMADQFSDEVYIYVKRGQRVKKGDLIGHQGNRCFWAPKNVIVHLHFGVYDIRKPKQVPLDPTPYIGVSCTTLDQEFKINKM